MRFILLIDMDYFFVACEELKDPSLKDKPAAVTTGSDREGSKGVIMTCNYPARKFGVRSGISANQALGMCKDLVLLKEDFKFYEEKSAQVASIIRKYSNLAEQVSIDESFVDISDKVSTYEQGVKYAEAIKRDIRSLSGLPCSIGIGPNKLIAKMACDAAKPDGIRLVRQEEAKSFLSEMPVGNLYGVGRKTVDKLAGLGIATVKDLTSANKMKLMDKFGVFGLEMHNYANGIDNDEVVSEYETKSISRESTLKKDTGDDKDILPVLRALSREVFEEAKRQSYSFKVVTLKMRYPDFSEHLKSKTLKMSGSETDISRAAEELFAKYHSKEAKLRKIGVRISCLVKSKSQRSMSDFLV